jgi:hypothetical protein
METPSRGNSSHSRVPETPSNLTHSTITSSSAKKPRAKAKTVDEKVEEVLSLMKELKLTLAAFLFYLFRVYVHDGITDAMNDPSGMRGINKHEHALARV